jgi:dTDP-4-dehydrorhamnose reductase
MKVLVSGSNGQLGSCLRELSGSFDELEFKFCDSQQLDLTSKKSIEKAFLSDTYQFFVNCGAYTKVDKAEDEKELCYKINAEALGHIAEICSGDCKIIHISTDYVYHHNPGRALEETDGCHPQSVYAKSKLEGEKMLSKLRPEAIILRTSWVYSEYGHNFVKTMMRLGKERDELSIVADQIGSPTYAKDLAACIIHLIENDQQLATKGVFNYSNLGQCSWADFAESIFSYANIQCKVKRIPTSDYPTPAKRPLWSVMSKEKIKTSSHIEIPFWEDSLQTCLDILLKSNSL